MTSIIPYPDPTPEMLDDPMFNAIWDAIKGWDMRRNEEGFYTGATGNDARHILDAIRSRQAEGHTPDLASRLRSGQASPADLCDAADAVDERKVLRQRVHSLYTERDTAIAERDESRKWVLEAVERKVAAEAERDALKAEALEVVLPFAKEADRLDPDGPSPSINDNCELWQVGGEEYRRTKLTYGTLRRARAFIATHGGNLAALRHKCASSGFHEHEGCDCTDDELMARYSAPTDTQTAMSLVEQKGKSDA